MNLAIVGCGYVAESYCKTLGNYPELGRLAHQRIKSSRFVPFAELGHSPQVQDPARFNKALLDELGRMQ